MTKENDFSAHNEWASTKPKEDADDLSMLCNNRKPIDLKDDEKSKEVKPGDLNDPSTWSIV